MNSLSAAYIQYTNKQLTAYYKRKEDTNDVQTSNNNGDFVVNYD